MYSLIPSLVCDFYKTSHRNQYPAGTENIYSIMVPRSNKYLNKVDRVVSAGVSGFVVKYLVDFFMQAFSPDQKRMLFGNTPNLSNVH